MNYPGDYHLRGVSHRDKAREYLDAVAETIGRERHRVAEGLPRKYDPHTLTLINELYRAVSEMHRSLLSAGRNNDE